MTDDKQQVSDCSENLWRVELNMKHRRGKNPLKWAQRLESTMGTLDRARTDIETLRAAIGIVKQYDPVHAPKGTPERESKNGFAVALDNLYSLLTPERKESQ